MKHYYAIVYRGALEGVEHYQTYEAAAEAARFRNLFNPGWEVVDRFYN